MKGLITLSPTLAVGIGFASGGFQTTYHHQCCHPKKDPPTHARLNDALARPHQGGLVNGMR
jgi:hypothetical protein